MTKKRRAKSGEVAAFHYDVIGYVHESEWATRVTVRDKATGNVAEAFGYLDWWALFKAVRKLDAINRSPEAMIARLESAARELGPETPQPNSGLQIGF